MTAWILQTLQGASLLRGYESAPRPSAIWTCGLAQAARQLEMNAR